MRDRVSFGLAMLSLALLLPGSAQAQSAPTPPVRATPVRHNLLAVDTAGFTGFLWRYAGDFGLVYEHRIAGRHGLVIQGGFAHVHLVPMHVHVGSARIGYRFHFLPDSAADPYVGLLLGGRFGGGREDHVHQGGAPHPHPFTLAGLTAGVHLGLRWSLTPWLALSTRLGVAWNHYWLSCDQEAQPGAQVCADIRGGLAPVPVGLDSELSLGVQF